MVQIPSPRSQQAVIAAVGLAVLCGGVYAVGPLFVLVVLALMLAVVLVVHPGWAIAVAVLVPLAVEPDWTSMASLQRVYALLPGTKLSPIDLFVLLAVVAALLDIGSVREALARLGVLRLALGLLLVGLVVGAITGKAAGIGTSTVINDGRDTNPLFLVPIAVVSIVGRRVTLRRALVVAFAAAVVKALVGLLAYGAHASSPSGLGYITYFNAPANIAVMFALLFLLAARMRRVSLPAWMWWSAPLLLGSLVLSYRRSFWIGFLLGAVVVVALLLGRRGRQLVVPGVAVIVLVSVLALSGSIGPSWLSDASSTTGTTSSLSGRLLSLNPSTLSENASDRYRTEERRNVLADLKAAPITGLGLGVAYTQRYPESFENISHLYVHFAALWWWMKGGIVALIGYIALIVSLIASGIFVWRHHPDPVMSAVGVAAAAGVVGFAFAELTGTFVGPDIRSSDLMGCIAGLIAVAVSEARRSRGRELAGDAVRPRPVGQTSPRARRTDSYVDSQVTGS